ncbi:MAG TPA: penicillin-binding protein 2, partial [Candidatus Paceibacterota bacterium]|nr:penicillin-binding protein 2 [Candidatus Paceibacterota bacterium]
YAVPIELSDPQEAAQMISPIINKDITTLVKALSKPKSQYALLVEKADNDQVQKIKDLNLKGIYVKNKIFRSYPFGTMAAHIFGFISSGDDGQVIGRYGLESFFDKELRGQEGERQEDVTITPQDGKSLYLTLDRAIQNEAEKIIDSINKEWHADGATMIVQEPSTGKILAMATVPTFDPNEYKKYELKDFLNPAVQLPYEPGSVFKVITMSAGIDAGKITPQTTYNDTGFLKLDKQWTIYNWDYTTHGAWGKINMTNVIEHSLNVGAVFAQRQMGNNIFTEYVKKFGFGAKTGIELPGELAGDLRNIEKGYASNYATASYGQGITATPIQLVGSFSAIANGGVLMKPVIFSDQKPEIIRRVISQETAKKITDMMVSAVDVNKVAAIPQYNVAGKTGTAFTTRYNIKGYDESNLINTYIGFAPATNPKFTVFVKLNHPEGTPLAGQTVVPAFRDMSAFLLNYYNISPDRVDVAKGASNQ